MKRSTDGTRLRAAGSAALLLLAGGAMGVTADRLWLSPPEVEAAPLTAEAMATHLDLSASEAAHVRALLDSLHAEILVVLQQNPDALASTVRDAHRRIEAALPVDVRPEFQAWIRRHHDQMMDRVRRGPDHGVNQR